jgi:CRISPR-associated protein Cas1
VPLVFADPTLRDLVDGYSDRRPPLVLDLMEPLRPIVDRAILQFVQSNAFHPADFTIRNDGACRLNPEMARRVVGIILDDLKTIGHPSLVH